MWKQKEMHNSYPEKQSHNKMGVVVRYKECLRNHAAAIGGNALDGCGEFMPSGEEGSFEALKCSACNCHRSFHRKETEGEEPLLMPRNHGSSRIVIGPSHQLAYPVTSSTLVSHRLSGSTASEIEEKGGDHNGGGGTGVERRMVRKRSRTKFTEEQKEKMWRFAEKAGWKMQKVEESVVQQFCHEIGVKRRVLKVWIHNNKNNFANKKSEND